MKKKVLALTLAAVMTCSFAACGSKADTPADSGDSSVTAETPADNNGVQAPADNSGSEASKADSNTETASEASDAAGSSENNAEELTLQDLLESDEMQEVLDTMNKSAEAQGIVISLAADGNTFVYEYQLPDDDAYNSITTEQAATAFDPIVESYKGSVSEIFEGFETDYSIVLDAIRFTFYTADGNVLYSAEIPNE